MRVILNGDSHETTAPTLDVLLTEIELDDAVVTTALNGAFVAAEEPDRAAAGRPDRGSRPDAGRLNTMLELYGRRLESRLLIGTAQYPSPAILAESVRASGADIVTVSLRRENGSARTGQDFWALVKATGARILPNTAGCYTAREVITTAHMAREVFGTAWIKLEVVGEHDTLQPDPFGLVEAALTLTAEGFEVFPYTTDDLVVADRLLDAGCRVLMPWGAPIFRMGRSSSMPESARHRIPRRPWNWVTTGY